MGLLLTKANLDLIKDSLFSASKSDVQGRGKLHAGSSSNSTNGGHCNQRQVAKTSHITPPDFRGQFCWGRVGYVDARDPKVWNLGVEDYNFDLLVVFKLIDERIEVEVKVGAQ